MECMCIHRYQSARRTFSIQSLSPGLLVFYLHNIYMTTVKIRSSIYGKLIGNSFNFVRIYNNREVKTTKAMLTTFYSCVKAVYVFWG
jgi:hypothetical protein